MHAYEKPAGLGAQYASQFQDPAVVGAYRHREPYAEETFTLLRTLAPGDEPAVLDLGCGCGDLTRGLSAFAGTVDALDPSAPMLAEGRRLLDDRPNVRWILGTAEGAPLAGPYDLVTSAQSFHWMDWPRTAARIRGWLKPGSFFALVARQYAEKHWWNADLQALIDRFSTNREFQKYELIDEVKKSGLFTIHGDAWTAPVAFTQSVEELVESFHSRNGFSRNRMLPEAARAFDQAATQHLSRFAVDGVMQLSAISRVTWMRAN